MAKIIKKRTKRKKADITKDNINAIKGLFEYIFDILEKITVLFCPNFLIKFLISVSKNFLVY